MGIINCKKCGKIFNYDGYKVCLSCRKLEEEDFQKVKTYLYKNSGASMQQVAEETEVPVKKIIEYLRQGKLETKDNENFVLGCEKCGEPIKSGHYCEKCTKEVHDNLSGAVKSLKPSGGAKKTVITSNKKAELMKTKDRRKK